jgi:aminopeptidase N
VRATAVLCGAVVTLLAVADLASASPNRSFDVRSYVARVVPDVASRTVTGAVDIGFSATDDLTSVTFDSGDLVVDTASWNRAPVPFDQSDHRVRVSLPAVKAGTVGSVALTYHGAPKRGLTFISRPEQVYTVFATSEWMVCVDDPGDKATLDLTVVTPPMWTVVSHGDEVSATRESDSAVAHRFVLSSAASTYIYGFAAGTFRADVRQSVGPVQLRYVSTVLDPPSVGRVFADTPDMLRFFESKAGLPLPTATYSQVLTAGAPQQEASGFSLLPDSYGSWVLDHPNDITLAAHELAHQWWGNRVTCRSWSDFWLNEGMATFMAAAYVEHRFGREAYDRLVAGYKGDVTRLGDTGHDKPLVFPDWSHPTADDRTVVYRKGAYVLALLRETLGDDAFWKGIRMFTTRFDGGSVESPDLQREMERASGSDLHAFFAQWVFGTHAP